MAAVAVFAFSAVAQQPKTDVDDSHVAGTVNNDTASTPPSPSNASEGFSRWVEFGTLSMSLRWRSEQSHEGFHYFDNGQQRSLADGRFKFDKDGKYAVHFHLSSGHTFNWAYSDVIGRDYEDGVAHAFGYFTPLQLQRVFAALASDPAAVVGDTHIQSTGWDMYFRQLYFSATPIKQLSFEFGSLGIERGEGTEATTYDDDGYIDGERLRILDPEHLFVDQIAITFAYEGDVFQPNFFQRGERLGQSNYHQFFASKRFGSRLNASMDYTVDKGTHTLREALILKVPELKVIDHFRPELYQRLNDRTWSGEVFHHAQGYALTASKTLAKKFLLEGGVASIDNGYGVLTGQRPLADVGFSMNGDSFLIGTRVFARANLKVTPYLSFFGYFTHEITAPPAAYISINQQAINTGATIDFKSLLAKMHVM